MGWQCGACTFLHEMDGALACEMCNTPRSSSSPILVALCKESGCDDFVFGNASSESKRSRDERKRRRKSEPSVEISDDRNDGLKSDESDTCPQNVEKKGGGDQTASVIIATSKRKATTKKLAQMNLFGTVAEKGDANSWKRTKVSEESTASANSSASTSVIRNQALLDLDVPFPKVWEKAMANMREIFGIESLRNLQPIAIENALKRKSQIIVMATGGGKSLCYQLPAVCLPGLTIVVSPLIALMNDQVKALTDKGVAAALVSSASGQRHNREVLDRLLGRRTSKKRSKSKSAEPPLKPVTLLYCTPELVQTERFRDILIELNEKKQLALFAIDEAHCLSAWGHDFRPSFLKLSWLRYSFPHVPCIACTATATQKVISDIRETLRLEKAPCHMGTFNRENIHYQVRFKDTLDGMKVGGAMGDLVEFVKEQHAQAKDSPCSGIIYVHKRQDTEDIAREISRHTGIKASPYHAGLKDAQRSEIQRQWTNGSTKIAVATVAFGMGIDLPHVRYVAHWTIAKSVEGFYQESGRAGRDGLPAVSVVYYSKDDASRFSYLLTNARKPSSKSTGNNEANVAALESMVNYCTSPCCRRQFLLAHFGEKVDAAKVCNKTCDFCQSPSKVEEAIRVSGLGRDFLHPQQFIRAQKSFSDSEWDGQWGEPHMEDSNELEETLDEGLDDTGLSLTGGYVELESSIRNDTCIKSGSTTKASFTSAKKVLEKYEVMECQQGESNGFVNFRQKLDQTKSSSKSVVIPQHLSRGLQDPLAHFQAPKKQPDPSSTKLSSEAERLKEELKQLREQKAAQLKALKAKPARVPKAVAPTLAFTTKRK